MVVSPLIHARSRLNVSFQHGIFPIGYGQHSSMVLVGVGPKGIQNKIEVPQRLRLDEQ